MKKFKLRDYQADDLKRINKEIKAGHKRVLYSLMTAGGKTVVLHEQVSRWLRKGLRGCVLVHTRALLNQTCAVFSDVPHGIIAGGIKSDPDKKLQICMVQSLARRGGKAFDFIVVDEAHHATASTWARILADSPEAIIFGVTATPFRTDGRGLGQAGFTTIVEGPEVAWLTEQGFLSPVEYYAPTDVDMTGVKKVGGDYARTEASKRSNKSSITGSAIWHYKRHANGQRALVFCADIKHVLSVTKKFKKAGLNAAFIHGKMNIEEREDILAQFAESQDMILVSCELIGEGLDVPAVACIILLRPTASLVRFIQQVGRGLRVVEGKKHVVVLDHVGNIRLGHPHAQRDVSLIGKVGPLVSPSSPQVKYIKKCRKCHRVCDAESPQCSGCGYTFAISASDNIEIRDGYLCRFDGFSDSNKIRLTRNGRGMFCFRTGGESFTLGTDASLAKEALGVIVSAISENGGDWPEKKKIRDLIRDFMLRNARIPKIQNDGTNFVIIRGRRYGLGPDLVTARVVLGWVVERRARLGKWPSHDEVAKIVGASPFVHATQKDVSCVFEIKNKDYKSLRYGVRIRGATYSLGNNYDVALSARDSLSKWFNKNDRKWPVKIGILVAEIREAAEGITRKPSVFTSGLSPKTYRVKINGYVGRLGGNRAVAYTARDFMRRFYESNNYEWPPKSEVPALVKKALEHAKSTLE